MTDCQITYRRGPIGWAVSANGKPVGVIKLIPAWSLPSGRNAYMVSIVGFRPGDTIGQAFKGSHVFPTLKSAKAKVASVLCNQSA